MLSVKFDQINKQSGPRTSREDENPSTKDLNTRVPAQLVVNMVTRGNTDGIKKVQTYQNFITATIPDILRNTVGRQSGKEDQIKKRKR